jgi:hypothetical protein
MAAQSAAAGKAVIEKLGEELLILGEGHQAVADVAGRKNAEITPQAAGAAALVCDGDNGGEPGNLRPKLGRAARLGDVVFKAT